ncbi:flavodoxin family protein [Clostridioides difficile]|nr:flavodoxin family protein [Clostridioides difficile]
MAITGSNNINSTTKEITDKILDRLTAFNQEYSFKNIFLGDLNIRYCIECKECYYNGSCKLDKLDDMIFIRKKMNLADVILFSSPEQAYSVSGIMKIFIDRLSYQFHVLSYSGKLGFTLAVTDDISATDKVNKYLSTVSTNLGIKTLSDYIFSNVNNSTYEKITSIAEDIHRKIQNNYGYSNFYLESLFRYYKYLMVSNNKTNLENELSQYYEKDFWTQSWIKKTDSFQEFAVKKRSLYYDLK